MTKKSFGLILAVCILALAFSLLTNAKATPITTNLQYNLQVGDYLEYQTFGYSNYTQTSANYTLVTFTSEISGADNVQLNITEESNTTDNPNPANAVDWTFSQNDYWNVTKDTESIRNVTYMIPNDVTIDKLISQDDCIATMNATTNALVADGYVVNYNDTTLDTTTYSATQHYDFNLTSGGFLIDILNETLESIYDSNGLLINQTINIL